MQVHILKWFSLKKIKKEKKKRKEEKVSHPLQVGPHVHKNV